MGEAKSLNYSAINHYRLLAGRSPLHGEPAGSGSLQPPMQQSHRLMWRKKFDHEDDYDYDHGND